MDVSYDIIHIFNIGQYFFFKNNDMNFAYTD